MSSHEKGMKYEDFITEVYWSIWNTEISKGILPEDIKLERRKKIVTPFTDTAEIDIYWEYELSNGHKQLIIMECKDWKKTVGVKEIRDFNHKVSGLECRALLISKGSVSSEVLKVAESTGIEVIIMRKPEDYDWDGYIQK